MKGFRLLVGVLLAVGLGIAPARAQTLDGSVSPNPINGSPGDTITVQGELQNNGAVTLFINGSHIDITAPPGTFNADDSPFISGAPISMDPGDATAFFDFFMLEILTGAPPGTYTGIFEVLGGTDPGDANVIGTIPFTVNVSGTSVPEGDALTLLLGALPAIGLIVRRRRARSPIEPSSPSSSGD
jgi:hypothetical protein